jgi:hypothetical protein
VSLIRPGSSVSHKLCVLDIYFIGFLNRKVKWLIQTVTVVVAVIQYIIVNHRQYVVELAQPIAELFGTIDLGLFAAGLQLQRHDYSTVNLG